MRYITNTTDFTVEEDTAVTLGKFDGLHRGHWKLFESIILNAKKNGWKTVVFTFAIAPAIVLTGRDAEFLNTGAERRQYLESLGIDYLIEYPFNREVSSLSPAEFLSSVLIEKLHMKYLAVGADFRFGYQRMGTTDYLKEQSGLLGYQISVLEKELDHGREISSTYIKEALHKGNMELVTALMGRPYSISGQVIHGRTLGRTLGFPTLNIAPPSGKALPPFGVYCTTVEIDGVLFYGVGNIGVKPTVEEDPVVLLEVHVLDYAKSIYGKTVRVFLHTFERPEQKFNRIYDLKLQLEQDVEFCRLYFQEKRGTYGEKGV